MDSIDFVSTETLAVCVPTPQESPTRKQSPRDPSLLEPNNKPLLTLAQRQSWMKLAHDRSVETVVVDVIVKALENGNKDIGDVLVPALVATIRAQHQLLESPTSIPSARARASAMMCWLFDTSLKASRMMAEIELRRDEVRKDAMAHAARKAKHKAVSDSVVVIGMKERKKAARILARVQEEMKCKQELQQLEQQLAQTPKTERVIRLSLKQELARLRNRLRGRRGK